MGKFFADLPNVPSLANDTLFAVSDATTIKTYKTDLEDIGDFLATPKSGCRVRLSGNWDVTKNVNYEIPFDVISYDLRSEYNLSTNVFEPTKPGMYYVHITIAMNGIPGWQSMDDAHTSIYTGALGVGQMWNCHIHLFPTNLSVVCVTHVETMVRITDPINQPIHAGFIAEFTAGTTRQIIYEWANPGGGNCHTHMAIAKIF